MSRQRAAKAQRRMNPVENTISFNQAHPKSTRRIDLIPRTRNQERLVLALQDTAQHIVVTAGPAGTGKTYLAVACAIEALQTEQVRKIILVRPAVEAGEKLGKQEVLSWHASQIYPP